MVSYQGGNTQNKNGMVFENTEAGDRWNLYHAKINKRYLMELAIANIAPDNHDVLEKELVRYRHEKQATKVRADQLDAQSRRSNELTARALHPHRRFAQAMTLIQIAIALASITALTCKAWLLAVAGASGLKGVLGAALAYV